MAGVTQGDDLEPEVPLSYKAPEKKTLQEIQSLDQEDESLVKYKQTLLGAISTAPFPEDPRNFILKSVSIDIQGQEPIYLDLKGDPKKMKDTPVQVKEGSNYSVVVEFFVQREIICGLKYVQCTYRKGIKVEKTDAMLGSYGPKAEAHIWKSDLEEAPKGMLARGTYTVKSRFTDDDKTDHCTWEWSMIIEKE